MKRFRVAEIFGPTIQGEGRRAGLPCYFIRFGGCDYRCTWCDSPHAVLPDLVAQLPQKSEDEILQELLSLPQSAEWVVFSGGNPCLLDLKLLQRDIHTHGFKVMVETQGTEFKDWLRYTDEICVSPKPPSSGNTTDPDTVLNFLVQYHHITPNPQRLYLKVVVFDSDDYEYARTIRKQFPNRQMFLSVGTEPKGMPTVGNPNVHTWGMRGMRQTVSDDFKNLAERMTHDPHMRDVRVLPQLHVIAWGAERGR